MHPKAHTTPQVDYYRLAPVLTGKVDYELPILPTKTGCDNELSGVDLMSKDIPTYVDLKANICVFANILETCNYAPTQGVW